MSRFVMYLQTGLLVGVGIVAYNMFGRNIAPNIRL